MKGKTKLAALAALLVGCGGAGSENLSEAALRGQKTYQNVCIACHAADPNVDGAIGPAVAGSSLELLQARVLHGDYPPGYTPKRQGQSQAMPVFPYLEEKLPDLAAYLAEVEVKQAAAAP